MSCGDTTLPQRKEVALRGGGDVMGWRESVYKAIHEKNAIQRQLARRLFNVFQFFGFHLTADHFYDIIPNTKSIEKSYSDDRRNCTGVDFHFMEMEVSFLKSLNKYSTEIESGAIFECGFVNRNGYFRDVDPIALYTFIREYRPKIIIEVGQGMSTRVIAAACKQNWRETGYRTSLITIDPYARLDVSEVMKEWIEVEHRQCGIQDVDPSLFRNLGENDLLFIDSSHVFKHGSDVEYEFDNVYPVLQKGVVTHIHDIFSPFDYPKRWMVERKQFWNEQYFLENFLRFNSDFQIVLSVHMLVRSSNPIRKIIPNLLNGSFALDGCSLYIKRVH